jgi:hypothetical protein
MSDARQQLEPEDYYLEDGLMVFTAVYHLKRGACCGNNCRHCPYNTDSDNHLGGEYLEYE